MGEILTDGPWAGFEVISTYTRDQAIDDGVLVDLSSNFPSDTRMFKWSVCCTDTVWSLIKNAAAADDVEVGVYVWDVCNMAAMTAKASPDSGPELLFTVMLPLRDNGKDTVLKLVCGPIGPRDPSPCITIMLPEED